MTTAVFELPRVRATDANNTNVPGAQLYFYTAGTNNQLTVFKDADLTTPHAIPVVADGSGTFAPIYLPIGAYKYKLTDAFGLILATDDNIVGPVDPSTFTVTGAVPATPTKVLNDNYTIPPTEVGYIYDCQTANKSFAVTLPAAATVGNGKGFCFVKSQSANTLSVVPIGTDQFSGTVFGTSYQIATAGQFANVVSSGAGYLILALTIPAGAISPSQLSTAITGSFVQIGSVIMWDAPGAIPAGYLEQNGTPASRTTYPQLHALYQAQGYPYGNGDGTTTFGIRDMRGYFPRGQDAGRGIDPDAATRTDWTGAGAGDVVNSFEADAIKAHTHTATATTTVGNAATSANSSLVAAGGDTSRVTTLNLTAPAATTSVTVNNNGTAGETRPKNANFRFLVFASTALATGSAGNFNTLLNGIGPPSDALGNNGDFYRDLASGKIWGPKASATWAGTSARMVVHPGLNYLFSTTTTATDPTNGYVAFNNATPSSVTSIYISEIDNDTNAVAALIASWAAEGQSTDHGRIRIQKHLNSNVWAEFKLSSSPVDNGFWDTLPVAYVAGAGTFSAADNLAVIFTPAGVTGPAGANGTTTVTYIGGTGSGAPLQSVGTSYAAYSAVTNPMTEANSAPLITDGTQILSAAITPALVANKIRITVDIALACSSQDIIAAVYRNGATCIGAIAVSPAGANKPAGLSMKFDDLPNAVVATTYSLRVGPAGAGTVYLNGNSSGALFAGLTATTMTLTEVLP